MYIYSLGHFLTTKGALINGVWGFGLTPPKMSKITQKFTKKIKMTKN